MHITNKTIFALGTFLILIVILFSLMRTTKKSDETEYAILTNLLDPDAFIDYDYAEVTSDVIRRKMRTAPESVALVDVRSAGQFRQRRIVGSTNLPIDSLISGNVAPNYNADMVVIVFDELNANIISQAIKIFEKQNDYVVALSGGIDAWQVAGSPIISAGDPTSIIDAAKVRYISQEDLLAIIEAKKAKEDRRHIILDVRPSAQFNRDHIPYAINIQLADLERMYNILPSTKKIIVYGSTAVDSFRGGVQLYDLSFFTAQTLDGGYVDWVRNDNNTTTQGN